MNFTCKQSELLSAINIALKAVSNKTTLPILECILIEAYDQIRLTATDMDLGIETYVEGEIIETGKVAVNAKFFYDVVKNMPESDITITTNDQFEVFLKCETVNMKVYGKSGDDFSPLPDIDKSNSITLSQFILKDVIRQTIFSVVENDNAKMMGGELFEINDNKLTVTSLDGHRISIRNVTLNESHNHTKVIVPGKTLRDISKILEGNMDSMVDIFFTDRHILFEIENTRIVSRLLEGEYYKIYQMLSNDYETKIVISKKVLSECIARSLLMSRESEKRPLILTITKDNIAIQIKSNDGSVNENHDIIKEGKDLIIGFDARLFVDPIRVIDDENISIYFMNQKSPCFIKNDDETYRYVILPLNINV